MLLKEKLANICQWLREKSFVICCGIAPVILLSALLVTCSFGCNVIVNGEVIGTAPNAEYVQNLVDSINTSLSPYLDGVSAVDVTPVTTPKLVFGKKFTDIQILGERLKSYCPYLENAYTVKSNGKTVAAFLTDEQRKVAYDKFIDEVSGNSGSFTVLDDITMEYELVPYGLIKTGSDAYKMLMSTYEFSATVGVEKGDKLNDILSRYAISQSDFEKLNPAYKEGESTKVKIISEIPNIRVLTTENYVESTVVKYSTKYETDGTMYEGDSKIKTEGTNGFKSTKKVRYSMNGLELCENVLDVQEETPVTQVVLMGTKVNPKGKSSGSIEKPCVGVLTSRFGSRGGRQHKGIDISGVENSDVKAADGGVVTYADWDDSGYGYVVKIEHPSGYTTLYAHCNKLYVSKGDKVNQGDVIAALGNTGRSTGPHVHFEVIVTETGIPVNPLSFFNISEIK